MSSVRQHIEANGGSFAKALLRLHEEPTFDNLMEAYTLADLENRKALEAAAMAANITRIWSEGGKGPANPGYTDEYLDLEQVHQMWLKMRWGGDLIRPLETQFESMRRLDEENPEPWTVPLRRRPPTA